MYGMGSIVVEPQLHALGAKIYEEVAIFFASIAIFLYLCSEISYTHFRGF